MTRKVSDDVNQRVMDLWNDDKTSTEIAAQLDLTRSKVSGIIHRMKAKGFVVTRSPAEPTVPKPRRRRRSPAKPAPAPKQLDLFEQPVGIGIFELKKKSCRWPLKGAVGAAMRYCGETTQEPPYCMCHSALAYTSSIMPRHR